MTDADITADLNARLARRYSAPEWYLATEATVGGRRADGIAINLWRSRGWVVHGFEIKASRGDWFRELKNPEKADHIAHVVDAWWVVAPRGVVLDGELPAGWGLLERSGRGLRAKTSPRMPKDLGGMDRELAARLVARVIADEQAARDRAIGDAVVARYAEMEAAAERLAGYETRRLEQQIEDLRRSVKTFEEKSGVKIDQWCAGRIGEAVRIVLGFSRSENPMEGVRLIAEDAAKLSASFENLVKHMEEK